MPAVAEARPPYVMFETRAVEDRAASLEKGHYVTRDVDYAIITPMGSKDRTERVIKEWFDQLQQQVAEGRFPGNGGQSSWQPTPRGRKVGNSPYRVPPSSPGPSPPRLK